MKFNLIFTLVFAYFVSANSDYKEVYCVHSGDYKKLLETPIDFPQFGQMSIYHSIHHDRGGYAEDLFRAESCPTKYWTLGIRGWASGAADGKNYGMNYIDWYNYKKEEVTHVCIGDDLTGFTGSKLKTEVTKGDPKIIFQKYKIEKIIRFKVVQEVSYQNQIEDN